MAATIRGWRLGRRTDLSFAQIATWINRIVAGWINYYGRFYKSLLLQVLERQLHRHLVSWACRKYKHLHRHKAKARRRLAAIATAYPGTFVHWRHGALPSGSAVRAV